MSSRLASEVDGWFIGGVASPAFIPLPDVSLVSCFLPVLQCLYLHPLTLPNSPLLCLWIVCTQLLPPNLSLTPPPPPTPPLLHLQGYGKPLWLVHGFFRANGGCGYVKKPDWFLKPPGSSSGSSSKGAGAGTGSARGKSSSGRKKTKPIRTSSGNVAALSGPSSVPTTPSKAGAGAGAGAPGEGSTPPRSGLGQGRKSGGEKEGGSATPTRNVVSEVEEVGEGEGEEDDDEDEEEEEEELAFFNPSRLHQVQMYLKVGCGRPRPCLPSFMHAVPSLHLNVDVDVPSLLAYCSWFSTSSMLFVYASCCPDLPRLPPVRLLEVSLLCPIQLPLLILPPTPLPASSSAAGAGGGGHGLVGALRPRPLRQVLGARLLL